MTGVTFYKAKKPEPVQDDDTQRVRWLSEQFDRYDAYWRPEIERAIRNGRMYWQVNFGAWPAYVVERLRNQGRRPPSFPIVPDKLETLVGSFLSNDFDIKYEPRSGDADRMSYKVQDIYFSDKNTCDWEQSKIQCLLDSFIMMGAERMVIRSDVGDGFGNIGWETIDATRLLLAPEWKSNEVEKLNNYFTWSMMTAKQIVENPLFKTSSERLRALYEKEKAEGIDYGQYQGALPKYKTVDEKWSSQHRVIEFHHVIRKKEKYEYDLRNHQFFPDTGYPLGSDDDIAAKKQYYQQKQLNEWEVRYMHREKVVKRVETVVPSIDKHAFLQRGKSNIQVGSVNLFPLGIRYKGQWQGICDRLYDVQINFNKLKMNIQDIQQRSAHGAFIMDRALSGGDVELERQIEQGWNDPAARIWVDENSTRNLPGGGVLELPSSSPGNDLFREQDDYLMLADRFSKVSAAQDSRTEGSKESGRLFRYKLEVGQVGQKFLLKFYETHEKAKARAYLRQIKLTYAGLPRSFRKVGSNDVIWINQPMEDIVTGDLVTVDDISLLGEMDVIITPSQSGINIRTELRSQYAEMMDAMNGPNDGLMRVTYMKLILQTQDMPDEHKEELKHAISLQQRFEASNLALMAAKNEEGLKRMLLAGQVVPGNNEEPEETLPPQVTQGLPGEQQISIGTNNQ